jgi:uncharacterized membrane protein YqjE
VADGDSGRVNGGVDEQSLGDLVSRVSENASLLIREEIELAKTEIELKMRRLVQGAAVGAAAGFFVFLALIFAFHALSWGLSDILNNGYGWQGYLITTVLLLVLGGIAGLIAMRAFKAGAPPTPDRAIEEAKLIREALEHPEVEAARAGTAETTPKP